MTGYSSSNRPSKDQPDWLAAICRNPSLFNPRTTFVHSLITIPGPLKARDSHRSVPSTTELRPSSPSVTPPPRPMAPISLGFRPSHVSDFVKLHDEDEFDSDDDGWPNEWPFNEPLVLEHMPPYTPRKVTTSALYDLHSQLRQGAVTPFGSKPEEASVPIQSRDPEGAHNQSPQSSSSGLFEESSSPGYIRGESFSPQADLTCSSLSDSASKKAASMASGSKKLATRARRVKERVRNWVRKLSL